MKQSSPADEPGHGAYGRKRDRFIGCWDPKDRIMISTKGLSLAAVLRYLQGFTVVRSQYSVIQHPNTDLQEAAMQILEQEKVSLDTTFGHFAIGTTDQPYRAMVQFYYRYWIYFRHLNVNDDATLRRTRGYLCWLLQDAQRRRYEEYMTDKSTKYCIQLDQALSTTRLV